MMKPVAAACLLVALAACAPSDPVAIGPDTYMSSRNGVGAWLSVADMQEDIYRNAATFCARQGREMMPVRAAGNEASRGTSAHADVEFRCLPPDDPDLGRPRIVSAPQIGISVQNAR